jgi:type III pantothenate kinase
LTIGNSRLHWACFSGETLCCAWDSDHLSAADVPQVAKCWAVGKYDQKFFPPSLISQLERTGGTPSHLPVYLASVVPAQTSLWQTLPGVRVITLEQIPLPGTYPTLGVDRALALWGAGVTLSWPVLVIDAGTALTFTGADSDRQLVGGAILPGLKLQLNSLAQGTAALPKIELPSQMPPRWAATTQASIHSGVIYTLLAGVRDFISAWWQQFPESRIAITGGDRTLLLTYLQAQFPEVAAGVIADPHLIFWGMRSLKVISFEL